MSRAGGLATGGLAAALTEEANLSTGEHVSRMQDTGEEREVDSALAAASMQVPTTEPTSPEVVAPEDAEPCQSNAEVGTEQ